MIGMLLGLIILLVIIGVLFWAAQKLMALIPLAEPFRTVIYVLFVVLAVLIVVWVFVTMLEAVGVRVPIMHMSRLAMAAPKTLA